MSKTQGTIILVEDTWIDNMRLDCGSESKQGSWTLATMMASQKCNWNMHGLDNDETDGQSDVCHSLTTVKQSCDHRTH
jgi:agmatine/peptidylarginine deiminase